MCKFLFKYFFFFFFLITSVICDAQQPPPIKTPERGPYTHQIFSASSPDGLQWQHDNIMLLDHASVPAAIVTLEGKIWLFYVDASPASAKRPERTNCAESADGGETFSVLNCTITNLGSEKAVDPSIVRLSDGRYRLYYYATTGNPDTIDTHYIRSAISKDGVHFEGEQIVFSYPGLVDPDVFWTGTQWLMFVYSITEKRTIVAKSSDGLNFTSAEPLSLKNWGTTAAVKLNDGRLRLYAFDQPASQKIASFVSTDGLNWTQEPGIRLSAPMGKRITDPFVIQLKDGTWKMFFKVEKNQMPKTKNSSLPAFPPLQ